MTDTLNTLPAIDMALRRTRRIIANLVDAEDIRTLEQYVIELERRGELIRRAENR